MGPLVEAAARGLTDYLHRPFAFFGHSLGALIAFELARHLHLTSGIRPTHVFLSACRAPQTIHIEATRSDLSDTEFQDELRRMNGTPAEVLDNRELMQFLLPTLRADFRIYDTYRYQRYDKLDVPMTVLGGREDRYVTRDHLEAWRERTSGTFSLGLFEGGHFFLHTQKAGVITLLREMISATRDPPADGPAGAWRGSPGTSSRSRT
jgi:medium-chain acyl-[acyl-carrier-protein] hydrolase